ncbi:MAG: hypothetical protein AVDCRST_MAG33-3414 [uncultured Thermomicrobiales bacterium]|uniref:DUF4126 domain-containing protein n=1 Tax=uncultured Thermomicrobiales bacterium TaxID=1645740 RepID=A0A6J4VI20_9BACT|nr:MAG: hypothetical protein AVDCRST_MAG33-3414 [uncultured Thermomicrobiales bacterium]
MPHSTRIIVNTLTRTFAIGIAAGLRSQVPGAALTQALRDGNLGRGRGRLWSTLRRDRSRQIALVSMVGEMVGDKLPVTPSRTEAPSNIGRIGIGAVSGALVASGLGARSGGLVFAALSGAAGAVVGTWGGYHARKGIVESSGLPDLPIALVEDIAAVTIARLAVAREL